MKYCAIFFLFIGLWACGTPSKEESKRVKVVCTTGMLGDALKNILSEESEIITLMKSGVDPHLYKATQSDVEDLMEADIIVYNGLHLEGKMGQIFEKLEKRKIIIAAGDGVPESELINNTDFQGARDPHIWFDVELWSKAMEHVTQELIASDLFDSSLVNENWNTYKDQLKELDKWAQNEIEDIPQEQRILITSHDAFSYFGKAYNIKVRGLQGISTVSEYGLKDVSELVNYIVENKIRSVFIESSVSERSMQAVVKGCQSKGHDVQIGGTLYSDAMGAENKPEGKYIGMVRYNVTLIKEGLK